MENLKRNISCIFKLNGLTIKSDGIRYLCKLLEPINEDAHNFWIEKIIDSTQKISLTSSILSKEHIEQAAEAVRSSEIDEAATLFQVIDSSQVPNWKYDIERKKFVLTDKSGIHLHGDAESKASLFRDRYSIVYQRTVNHDSFRVSNSIGSNNQKRNLMKIEYLLGLSNRQTDLIVLGLLTQMTEGDYHLEDDTGHVKIDLENAKFNTGLFTVNCFVLVEGWFEEKVLHATAVALPPPESAQMTRALVGNVNYFGGRGTTCAKYSQKFQEWEKKNSEAMIVFLSDVLLDNVEVMEKITKLFQGYSMIPPVAFIFCGNFLSYAHGSSQLVDLKTGFAALKEIILSVPELSSSYFVFVPGPSDPGPGNIYPRPPLPTLITEDFKRAVPNSIFASNPCRILYCTKEIVVFREDVFTKMCRNSIYFSSESSKAPSHFARTLVCEAHLSPLPIHTVPIYWGLDHCLALHPSPDLIVVADKGDPFVASYNSSSVINPGSFSKTDFSFKVYVPFSGAIEDCQINE